MTTDDIAAGTRDHDETVAGTSHGAGGDETEVVTPVTEAAPELAWSHADADDETAPVEPQSWRLTIGHAGVIIAVAFVVALAIGVVGWVVLVAPHRRDVAPLPHGDATPKLMPAPAAALPPVTSAPAVVPRSSPPVAPPTVVPDDYPWVAVAVSASAISKHLGDLTAPGLFFGGSDKGPTRQDVTKLALDQCAHATGNSDCQLLNNGVHHGCIAYMIDQSNGAFASGTGPTADAAIGAASRALGAQAPPRGESACSTHAGEGS